MYFCKNSKNNSILIIGHIFKIFFKVGRMADKYYCKVCRGKLESGLAIKDGYICMDCKKNIPDIFDRTGALYKLTGSQINNVRKIISQAHSKSWGKCKNIKLCDYSLIINDWEISLKDIMYINMEFHPRRYGETALLVGGILTVKIETKEPHLIIEEIFIPDIELEYKIQGNNIYYRYPKRIWSLFSEIQKNLASGKYNLLEMRDKQIKEDRKIAEEKRKSAEARKKGLAGNSPFDKAKALYQLEIPFTEAELKKRRNELIKHYHPDESTEDSTEDMTKLINEGYALLKEYVV